jgi:hypothetical protein
MALFTSFRNRFSKNRKSATPDNVVNDQPLTTEQAAPTLPGKEPVESTPKYQYADISEFRGKVLLECDNFMIALPQRGPVCAVCSCPTYSEAENDGQIVIRKSSEDNADLMRNARKVFFLAAGTSCNNCSSHLCWNCIIMIGLGSCPKCQRPVDEHPGHSQSSWEVLTQRQVVQAGKALLIARQDGEKSEDAAEAAAQRLAADGWDDVDKYFGKRWAQDINMRLVEGRMDEAEFRSLLESYSTKGGRRIVSVNVDGEEVRIVAGSAFVNDEGGMDIHVMAEFEDGQVRCLIKKNLFAEMMVKVINKR